MADFYQIHHDLHFIFRREKTLTVFHKHTSSPSGIDGDAKALLPKEEDEIMCKKAKYIIYRER